jgi:hypothetical protein
MVLGLSNVILGLEISRSHLSLRFLVGNIPVPDLTDTSLAALNPSHLFHKRPTVCSTISGLCCAMFTFALLLVMT